MLTYFSARIADVWTKNHVIPEEEKDVYKYGIELLLSVLINLCCLILISVAAGQVFAWIFYLLSFIPLRTVGGGYHAPTHLACVLISSGMFCVALLLSLNLPDGSASVFCGVTSILSVFIFWYFAPVEAVNKPLAKGEFFWNRKLSRIFVCFISMFILIGTSTYWDTSLGLKLLCCGEGIAAINLIVGLISCKRRCLPSV